MTTVHCWKRAARGRTLVGVRHFSSQALALAYCLAIERFGLIGTLR